MALLIGNDASSGHGARFMPHVNTIGEGAVTGAGVVVSKDNSRTAPYLVRRHHPWRKA